MRLYRRLNLSQLEIAEAPNHRCRHDQHEKHPLRHYVPLVWDDSYPEESGSSQPRFPVVLINKDQKS